MKIQLMCPQDKREELQELLTSKGFEIVDKSEYVFLDKSYSDKSYIFGKDAQKALNMIGYDTILYFESFNKITEVVTENGRYEVSEKLYELEQALYPKDFIRVGKSVIVNLINVDRIIPWIGSKYVLELKNGDRVEVTRTYFADFRKRLGL